MEMLNLLLLELRALLWGLMKLCLVSVVACMSSLSYAGVWVVTSLGNSTTWVVPSDQSRVKYTLGCTKFGLQYCMGYSRTGSQFYRMGYDQLGLKCSCCCDTAKVSLGWEHLGSVTVCVVTILVYIEVRALPSFGYSYDDDL